MCAESLATWHHEAPQVAEAPARNNIRPAPGEDRASRNKTYPRETLTLHQTPGPGAGVVRVAAKRDLWARTTTRLKYRGRGATGDAPTRCTPKASLLSTGARWAAAATA